MTTVGEVSRRGARHVERWTQHRMERRLGVIECRGADPARRAATGIDDAHVEAPERRDRFGDEPGRVARDRQVANQRRGGTNCLARFLGTLEVAADDGDRSAFFGERRGDGPAEPGRRTEDEGAGAVETQIHQLPSHTVRLTV